MSEYFDRRGGETVAEYAARMRYFVRLLSSRVSSIAGLGIDSDEVIDQLDVIVGIPDEMVRGKWWDLQRSIESRAMRLLDLRTLERIDAYIALQDNFLSEREAAEVSMAMSWNELLSRLHDGQSRAEVQEYVEIGLRDDWWDVLSRFVDSARASVAFMSEFWERETGEPIAEYAARVRETLHVIAGIIDLEAGLSSDFDEMIEHAEWIIEHARDGLFEQRHSLRTRIDSRICRIIDIETLARIEAYVARVTS